MRHDIAIVIITICRESLLRAVRSLFAQQRPGRMQILIGVDCDPQGRLEQVRAILDAECPGGTTLTWLDLGYSTSRRHGGVHTCYFGGSLRTALSFLADAEIVMYLDDDDWLAETHCADILACIGDRKWAFAYSMYADGQRGQGLCIDEIESVGVGKGIYSKSKGGFVRPSGMAINKLKLPHILYLWAESFNAAGDGEDRLIFEKLRRESHACTGKATVYYTLDPNDGMHAERVAFMQSKGVSCESVPKEGSVRSNAPRAKLPRLKRWQNSIRKRLALWR